MRFPTLAVAAVTLAAAPVGAQTLPEGVGVADRVRSAYLPVGGRIGDFFLYPRVDTVLGYEDNVRAERYGKAADGSITIAPALLISSNWNRHSLNTTISGLRQEHFSLSSEDHTDYGITSAGILDVSRDTRVRADFTARHLSEDRTAYEAVDDARSPVRINQIGVGLAAEHDFNRVGINAAVRFGRRDYVDAVSFAGLPLSQEYRDVDVYTATLGAVYELRGGIGVAGLVTLDQRRYDFDASSPGFRVGTDLLRNSSGVRAEGGLAFNVTTLLYGYLRVGYLSRNYTDARLRDFNGFSLSADILWNVTPLTSIRAKAERRVDESSSTISAGTLTTTGGIGLDHELLRNLILTADGSYTHSRPNGPVQKSREIYFAAGARYLLNRNLSFRLNYSRIDRNSNDLGNTFIANRIAGTVRLSL